MAEILYPKKITVRTMGIDRDQLDDMVKAGGRTQIARVWGEITSSELCPPSDASMKPYMRYKGQFAGANLITGTEYRSLAMILPEVADIPLNELTEALLDVPEGQVSKVRFALELGVEPNLSKKGGAKYQFTVMPLIKSGKKDFLTEMSDGFPKLVTDKTGKTAKK